MLSQKNLDLEHLLNLLVEGVGLLVLKRWLHQTADNNFMNLVLHSQTEN